MKKWIRLGALLLLLLPQRGTDVGELLPVEVLLVEKEAEQYAITTDTGNSARGDSLKAAMDTLRNTAPGVIFLDTADYVLLTEETLSCMDALQGFVRPGTKVYIVEGEADPERLGAFLRAHGPDTPLHRIIKEAKMVPKLRLEGDWHFEGR